MKNIITPEEMELKNLIDFPCLTNLIIDDWKNITWEQKFAFYEDVKRNILKYIHIKTHLINGETFEDTIHDLTLYIIARLNNFNPDIGHLGGFIKNMCKYYHKDVKKLIVIEEQNAYNLSFDSLTGLDNNNDGGDEDDGFLFYNSTNTRTGLDPLELKEMMIRIQEDIIEKENIFNNNEKQLFYMYYIKQLDKNHINNLLGIDSNRFKQIKFSLKEKLIKFKDFI